MTEITIRHKKFADAVLNGKTLISAYYEAGYKSQKETAAYQSASEILRNPETQAYIKERLTEQEAIDRMRLDRIRSDAIIQAQRLILEGTNDDRIKVDMVKAILDRTGFKPIESQKVEQEGGLKIIHEFVTPNNEGR